jgi:hypothetical protein
LDLIRFAINSDRRFTLVYTHDALRIDLMAIALAPRGSKRQTS